MSLTIERNDLLPGNKKEYLTIQNAFTKFLNLRNYLIKADFKESMYKDDTHLNLDITFKGGMKSQYDDFSGLEQTELRNKDKFLKILPSPQQADGVFG